MYAFMWISTCIHTMIENRMRTVRARIGVPALSLDATCQQRQSTTPVVGRIDILATIDVVVVTTTTTIAMALSLRRHDSLPMVDTTPTNSGKYLEFEIHFAIAIETETCDNRESTVPFVSSSKNQRRGRCCCCDIVVVAIVLPFDAIPGAAPTYSSDPPGVGRRISRRLIIADQ